MRNVEEWALVQKSAGRLAAARRVPPPVPIASCLKSGVDRGVGLSLGSGRRMKSMRTLLLVSVAVLGVALGGCASTSVKQTWKSPSYSGGPVKNVAVAVMTGRSFYREAIENHYVAYLKEGGQSAFVSHGLIGAPVKKEERAAAAAQLRDAGADSIMVVRLVNSETYSNGGYLRSPAFTASSEEAFGYFFMGPEVSYNSLQTDVYIETSLYTIAKGERIWSGVTRTVLREGSDPIEKIEPMAKGLFARMRQDGVIH